MVMKNPPTLLTPLTTQHLTRPHFVLPPRPVYGAVDAPDWVIPVGGLLAILTALLPVLLAPGEEAFTRQRALLQASDPAAPVTCYANVPRRAHCPCVCWQRVTSRRSRTSLGAIAASNFMGNCAATWR